MNPKSILLFAPLISMAVFAADDIHPVVGLGYDLGGEKVGSALFEDGTKENLHANEGIQFVGGFTIPLMTALRLQSTIGYQVGGTDADNGKMTWSSFPWETTLLAQLGNIRIGGGTVYHLSPEFKTSGFLADLGDFKFDDTLGYQAQIAWSPNRRLSAGQYNIGIRYSSVEFKRNDLKVDGDSTGIFVNYLF